MPATTVPLFGGFWMNSWLLAASITYCVVTPPVSGWPKLLVYAAPDDAAGDRPAGR